MGRDVLEELKQDTLVALLLPGEDWPRGLLTAHLVPDAWMALVRTRDGRRRFVPAGEDPRCERTDRLLLVRNRAITLAVTVADVQAAQGNLVTATCEVMLRWNSDENDLGALITWLEHDGPLTLEHLTQRFVNEGGRGALQKFVRERAAAQLTAGDQRGPLLEVLSEELKRFAFESGARVERVARFDCASESLQRRRLLERQSRERVERIQARETVERAALKATRRRLDDLGAVLEKLRVAADGDENMRWHDLLPALSPAERGRLLENLWRLTPDLSTARAIVAVSGDECVWIDPAEPDRIARRVRLPDDLGGTRSVSCAPGTNMLLVGAARGVWKLDAANGDVLSRFAVPDDDTPQTGFNAATLAGPHLYATHSQFGLRRWSLTGEPDPTTLFEPQNGLPKRVRSVIASDAGEILFAADDAVRRVPAGADADEEFCRADDRIHALACDGRALYVGTGRGQITRVSLDDADDRHTVHTLRDAVESIQLRRWNDLVELVVPAADEGIHGIYGDEHVVVRLLEASVPIRRAWASDDVVVGLSDRRDTLLVMNASMPERTARTVYISRETGRSIQDACIVAEPITVNAEA